MSRRERKLIRQLKARDEDAFSELVRIHQHKIFNLVYHILGNRSEAEDVAQEVFVSVFKYIDGFRGDAQLSTWLYRVATNTARNRAKYLARRSHRSHQSFEDTAENKFSDNPAAPNRPSSPAEVAMGKELEEVLQEGLQSLPEIHRTIMVLRDVEHLSYDEIAAVVELPVGTVKSRLFRARAALRSFVEERYEVHTGES